MQNQYVYYKGIMTSKFGSKDMLLWKRGSLVSTEDENLWIASRLVWFNGTRPLKVTMTTPQNYYA